MKKALVIGIDDYPSMPLRGCVNDAISIAELLENDGNGDPNFSVVKLVSNESEVDSELLIDSISELFSGEADTALLYFAGHGIIVPETNAGYIVSKDGRRGAWGVSLSEILGMANKAHPKIKSCVIILDCCHSGYAGEIAGIEASASAIGTGVTILTASHRDGGAMEEDGRGIFTDILLDGLRGGCSDILGNITPAAIYSHVDQTLGPWEQRPMYKANVQHFVTLRKVEPKVSKEILRRLVTYFPNRADIFALDPSFEPDRENIPPQLQHIPVNVENVKTFKELQQCNRYGLIVPVGADHMYDAAIGSTGCKLTGLGAHYRKLAEMKRI
ncbi:peptidase C14 caspase catalytic subunit p20 [Pseudomonas syringae]|uniref:caspase family protein n=1 Tax=Pseudomonas syringae TaxID=317 RepID=UPI00101026EA|nr:caspase family protein [Pseudomonas syringae]RXT91187.1 peptidase C14 caspase catalytic subunit p20 [Pseudomonas syringae]